jgi:hexosaminidase
MYKGIMFIIAVAGFLVSAQASTAFTQRDLKALADTLKSNYEVISNINVNGCDELFKGPCFLSEMQLTPQQATSHPPLQLYFSHIAPIAWDDSDILDIEHINGDLHRITIPADTFSSGNTIRVKFKAKFWHASQSDLMPNYYLLADGLNPQLVASTVPVVAEDTGLQQLNHIKQFTTEQQWRRGNGDNLALADAAWRYDYYQSLNRTAINETKWQVIPQLMDVKWQEHKTLSLANGIRVESNNWRPEELLLSRFPSLTNQPVTMTVELTGESTTRYQIDISEKGIAILASHQAAADYALLTLLQLMDEKAQVPLGSASDAPRYEFRGLHVDLARNFMGKGQLLSIIDEMFRVKLNKLHLHLADDEGWRLEIPQLPELTSVGAYRCHDLSEQRCLLPQLGSGPLRSAAVNGYLSTQDYLDILTYAKKRHIEVIPSFDMPGHARAAVKAMEARFHRLMAEDKPTEAKAFLLSDLQDSTEYLSVQFYKDNTVNPCQASTWRFLDTVIGQVQRLHRQANAPLNTYHIGADETAGAWLNSPVCKAFIDNEDALTSVADLKPYFLKRLAKLVNDKGMLVAGWSDGMHALVNDPEFYGQQVNVWDALFWQGHTVAEEFARQNWKTILSIPDVTYFDFPYMNHPSETGYYWASKQTDTFKVFQFQPEHLASMSQFWQDRMGNDYQAKTAELPRPAYAGMQAQIWTEAVRSNATVQYLLFPRLHAFAERAWHAAAWEGNKNSAQTTSEIRRDWQRFSSVLSNKILPRLAKQQPGFRLPPPGVKVIDGKVTANNLWPQLLLEYQDKQGAWHPYTQPVAQHNVSALRSRLRGSDKVSRYITL